MTAPANISELETFLQAAPDTEVLEIAAADVNGILRGKRLPRTEIQKPFAESGMNFCASSLLLDSKGNVFTSVPYGGRDGDPDVLARAVAGSLAAVPWASVPSAQVLVETANQDGSPLFLDPRHVLRNALQPLTDMGLRPVIATELEFYLLEHDGREWRARLPRIPGSELPQDGLQYSVLEDLVDVDPFLAELAAVCRAQNIPAGAAVSEFAPGQFEINLHHVDDPALACDHAVLLKRAVKAIARQHDLAASFMAKPFEDSAGCGMHIHLSLLDEAGNNVFAGTSTDGQFSNTLRHAIGGMAATMPESMAIFAPNANSYRRYKPKTFVPMTPSWGPNHRHLAMRIPVSSNANTRVEHRVAGADANPYLVVAAILAGMHHGIVTAAEPGPMVQAGEEVTHDATLPIRWEYALDAYDAGKILPQYLGQDYHRVFVSCRREECDRFRAEVSNRDYEWYLRAV
ncbi:MAG: glutamine synthetase family protein [Gammaproteobacteria bacterium]|nr:glutamine synthetase family protein [Gammaproteobacteria bacterium]